MQYYSTLRRIRRRLCPARVFVWGLRQSLPRPTGMFSLTYFISPSYQTRYSRPCVSLRQRNVRRCAYWRVLFATRHDQKLSSARVAASSAKRRRSSRRGTMGMSSAAAAGDPSPIPRLTGGQRRWEGASFRFAVMFVEEGEQVVASRLDRELLRASSPRASLTLRTHH